MAKKQRYRDDKHFLITVSDKGGTHYFKIPKLAKPTILTIVAVGILTLVGANLLIFSQYDELEQTKSQASQLEDAFVKLSTKNSSLSRSINDSSSEKIAISEVVAKLEQISGVDSHPDSGMTDRLDALYRFFSSDQINSIQNTAALASALEEQPIAHEVPESSDVEAETRVEPGELSISQQKLLHDSIPSGYPTHSTLILTAYGMREHPETNQMIFNHGVNLEAEAGSEIYATADGVVERVLGGETDGQQLVLTHNLGFESRYETLAELHVKTGDVVQKGDTIGTMGANAKSEQASLHYQVRYLGKTLDPEDFLVWEFGSQEIFTKVRGIQWHSLISLLNKQISIPTLQLSRVAPE